MNMHNNDAYDMKMLKIPNTFPYMRFNLIYLFYTYIHFDVFEWLNDVDVELCGIHIIMYSNNYKCMALV